MTAPLANAAQRNFQRWPNLSTATVGGFGTQTTQTWEQQIQIMRTFLTQRAAWLDSTSGWGGRCRAHQRFPVGQQQFAVGAREQIVYGGLPNHQSVEHRFPG